jgi:murein DD-endopeptidase MepM/ murein hydrolase activator NlpD
MAAIEAVPAEKRDAWKVHRVQEGDTVAQIAKRYGCTPTALASANGNQLTELDAGDLVVVPAAPARSKVASKKAPVRRSSVRTAAKKGTPAKSTTTAAKKQSSKPAAYKTAAVRSKAVAR